MTAIEEYRRSAEDALVKSGADRTTAVKLAGAMAVLRKSAGGYLPFAMEDDDDDSAPLDWRHIVFPLLGAAAAGFIGYQSRAKGFPNRSAWQNVKNYMIGSARNLVREGSRPFFRYKNFPQYDSNPNDWNIRRGQ